MRYSNVYKKKYQRDFFVRLINITRLWTEKRYFISRIKIITRLHNNKIAKTCIFKKC